MRDREKIIDDLFALAVDLDSEERLALFAAHRVNNESLSSEGVLDEVKALLADYNRAEAQGFLLQPLIATEEDALPPALRIGQQLNGYKILELIGEGGMGEVYLALDTELERKVAIKVIKSHLNSKELLRRFRNERQILANLQHPNIARLLESGTTTDQLPFFVMEYVEGQPIDKFADSHKLSITERLKLFRVVCSAVSYAHQNLIIHRDIKPSNILVTGDGEPKLLDFGIAKLLQASDSLAPNLTVTMFQIMTPEYASPEQVRGEAITTATDVYALGVLLYELLTGRYPHNLKRRSPREVARAVCEQDPERPSTAINRIEDSSESGPITAERVSETREEEPERLRRRLRGDIDNIILKSIDREPVRRYTSVGEFSEDIRRHLEGLPVVARKDTLKYRTSKFIRRNQIGVAAAAVILFMLVAGIVATGWEAHVAHAQEAKTARRFNEVRKLAHSVLFDYHDAIANLSGSTPVRERLVKDALEYLDSLAQDSGDDVSLQRELATAYIRVGDVQGRPYRSNLGQTEGALASYQKALVILEHLSASDPSSLQVKRDLAIAYERIGNIKSRNGDTAEAFEKNRAALAIRETVLAADPSNANYRRELGDSYLYFGDALANTCGSRDSLECARQALASQLKAQEIREALVRESPYDLQLKRDLAGTYMRLGFRFTAMAVELDRKGYLRQSLESHQKGVAIAEELAAANSDSAFDRRNLGDHLMLLADSQVENGYLKESLLGYDRALTIFRPLSAADPSNAEARLDLSFALTKQAHALVKLGNLTAAKKNYGEVPRIGQQSETNDPTNIEEFAVVVLAHTNLGELAEKEGDLSGAIENYGKVIGLEERFEARQVYRSHRIEMAIYYAKLGSLYRKSANARSIPTAQRLERWREAKDSYQKSLDSWQILRNKVPLGADSLHRSEEVSREIAELDHLLNP